MPPGGLLIPSQVKAFFNVYVQNLFHPSIEGALQNKQASVLKMAEQAG